jgi:hypothetical protein
MSQAATQRWAPLAGPIFLALMVIGFVISGDSPDPDASNAKIASFLGDDGNFGKNAVGFLVLLAALLVLVAFYAALRDRVVSAEGGNGRLGALAYGAGIANAVLLVLAIIVFISPILASHDNGNHPIDPGIYRVTQTLGYMTWVASSVVGALVVWAVSAVVLRTRMLPRWFGWFGVVVGVVALFSLFFFPIFLYWIWIAVAGILLARRPAAAPAAVAAEPTPAPAV